ncbi:MAG: hypothetical protein AAF677_15485, partial [Pseudomonadota bacterium]
RAAAPPDRGPRRLTGASPGPTARLAGAPPGPTAPPFETLRQTRGRAGSSGDPAHAGGRGQDDPVERGAG